MNFKTQFGDRLYYAGSCGKVSFCLYLLVLVGFCAVANAQTPELTLGFIDPQYNCTAGLFCVDAVVQSDTPGKEVFGINVRFFYDDLALEFLGFGAFQGGYGLSGTPTKTTGLPDSGLTLFGFSGAAEYIAGAVQLVDPQAPPLYVATGEWTKLFRAYFTVVHVGKGKVIEVCPSLVWDLKTNPSEGGFLGNDGVVMTVVGDDEKTSLAVDERVVQFNWEYGVNPGPPFGAPVTQTCAACGAVFSVPHPADLNVNYSITMGEAIASLSSWQQGATLMSHAIRAAYLWQNGEQYVCNPGLAPPLCWDLSR